MSALPVALIGMNVKLMFHGYGFITRQDQLREAMSVGLLEGEHKSQQSEERNGHQQGFVSSILTNMLITSN